MFDMYSKSERILYTLETSCTPAFNVDFTRSHIFGRIIHHLVAQDFRSKIARPIFSFSSKKHSRNALEHNLPTAYDEFISLSIKKIDGV